MAISGKYYIKKWLPNPTLVHGPDFQGGPPTGGPAGGPPPEGMPPMGGPGGPMPEGGMPPMGGPGGPMPEGGMPPMGGPAGGPPPAAAKPQVEMKDYGEPRHGAFEGDMLFEFEPQPDGTLKGTADGTPINWGFYTGDEFFKVDYPAGPGRWEIWARVDENGNIEGMISVGGNGGFPNFVYGKKID